MFIFSNVMFIFTQIGKRLELKRKIQKFLLCYQHLKPLRKHHENMSVQ